jgi:hypothetical protein
MAMPASWRFRGEAVRIRSYYHVYAAGAWSGPVTEHAEALAQAGWGAPVTVGLAGPQRDRDLARERITARFAGAGIPVPDRWAEADDGWEQVTLRQIHADVHKTASEYAVLYAHTKGAGSDTPLNAYWRRSMTWHVVSQWRKCVKLLEDGDYDTAGCHWLTPETHHRPPRFFVHTPMYGGNFWWAKASYLRQLPPPGTGYRHQSEEWVGLGSPKAADLLPGWPSVRLCAPEVYWESLAQALTARYRGPASGWSCGQADGTCAEPVTWVIVLDSDGDISDFLPLCASHKAAHDRQAALWGWMA